eukprot:jgi/Botrbrau1/5364/Bobra.0346s0034.1
MAKLHDRFRDDLNSGQMDGRHMGGPGILQSHTENMELEYRIWSNKRRLTFDLISMIGTFFLSLSGFLSVAREPSIDSLYLIFLIVMLTVSAGAILTITFKKATFVIWRDHVMASMWYSLAFAVLNYFPFVNRGLSQADPLRAFATICCHRWIGIIVAWVAWRIPVSWVPSVSFVTVLISARSAVRGSAVVAVRDPGNLYLQSVSSGLNFAVAGLCRISSSLAGLLGDGVPVYLPCDGLRVDTARSILLIWLCTHLLAFWGGFLLTLKDELRERQTFLTETGREAAHPVRPKSVDPMVLQMMSVQAFGFSMLLLFGNAM